MRGVGVGFLFDILIFSVVFYFFLYGAVKGNCAFGLQLLGDLMGFRGQLLFSWFPSRMFRLGFLFFILCFCTAKEKNVLGYQSLVSFVAFRGIYMIYLCFFFFYSKCFVFWGFSNFIGQFIVFLLIFGFVSF